MFVCPKCGTKDLPCWRNSRFLIYATYCRLDELEVFDPALALHVRTHGQVEIGPYFYWLRGRDNHVYRVAKELKDFANGHSKTEKRTDPFQQRLERHVFSGK